MLAHNTHVNEREDHAKRLGLCLKHFDEYVSSANHAYDVIRDLGPFYGREDVKDPTFRITAQPVKLPKGSKAQLTTFGNDLYHLGRALQLLPQEQKKKLGKSLDFRIPPTWRIDAIVNEQGQLKVNEVEGVDSANALMMAEQLAYDLQTFEESTAAKIIPTFKAMATHKKKHYRLAFIRNIFPYNPHTVNHERLIKFIKILSKGTITSDLLDEENIRTGVIMPDWSKYDGIINHTSLTPEEIYSMGVKEEQLYAAGNYNAMVNKGVFALLFDPELKEFWLEKLGKERFDRLTSLLIPTRFVTSIEDLENARKAGKVVKVSWADKKTELINRSKGVAMPVDSLVQGEDERWDTLKELFSQGVTLIIQDFVMPTKIHAMLRKKGFTLEPVDWYNRVCVKYVAEDNPNIDITPSVALTATEVTLGPEIIPAGRNCAFTAGKLS
ncbi:MAG TPA: hypothetical protein VLF93_07340 [Candidatus Saccharimonadales bacterium]|nr:hypothetical protein [Candidatus Saccharimonadales bacterium]